MGAKQINEFMENAEDPDLYFLDVSQKVSFHHRIYEMNILQQL